ncbi:MAG: glutamine amidotransferase [Cyanobacteria bacterium RM1_2_2]|nr:glutamine amidotransferase [Cyanobacteria bacterium RM1_2_2]
MVGEVLLSQGCQLEMCCPATGAMLPNTLDHYDGVVVFGAPMSANDDTTLPFIRAELDWIPAVLEAQKPFLGICLGAQLLARVLGAEVVPHPESWREIGYEPIQPTPEGQLLNGLSHVYHWHQEGFRLPQDATLLATGQRFANQAFQYRAAYGLQFHPEITQSMIERWTTDAADQLTLKGAQSRQEQLQNHDRYGMSVSHWLARFVPHWLGELGELV